MLFNSVPFLIFFPIVVTAYFLCPFRWRWLLIIVASYYFYMQWEPKYAVLIVISTILDYVATTMMKGKKSKEEKRPWLWLSIVGNLGMLFFFKYYNWVNSIVVDLSGRQILPFSQLLLPVGISFYTFQSLSYTIDVYRGRMEPEPKLRNFAAIVIYFPQLVAGPIERAKTLLPQLKIERRFDYERVTSGLKLMAWGMFKKVCIADRLAPYTKVVFAGDPELFNGSSLTLAAVLFCVQVYCDFSGYSDLAIGSAHVMGFHLMDNFKRPFFSRNIEELWSRWHMSLVSWLKDYVYQPLAYQARRASQFKKQLIVVFVFFVTGLWHGASLKFIAWGVVNGLFMVAHVTSLPLRRRVIAALSLEKVPRLHAAISIAFTFSLFSLGSIFFAAKSFSAALAIFGRLFTGWSDVASLKSWLLFDGSTNMLLAAAGIAILLIVDLLQEKTGGVRAWVATRPWWQRWSLYYGLVLWIVLFGVFEREEFVYFQF
jgi:alginate O-acetyltransferase complex protein AlgI